MMNRHVEVGTLCLSQPNSSTVFVLVGSWEFLVLPGSRAVSFEHQWFSVVPNLQLDLNHDEMADNLNRWNLVLIHFVLSVSQLKPTHLEFLDFPSQHLFGSKFLPTLMCESLSLISCSWCRNLHLTRVFFWVGAHVLEELCIDHYWFGAMANFLLDRPRFLSGLRVAFDFFLSPCHSTL